MRARMLVIILFTTIVFIAGCSGLMSEQQPANQGTINGAEIADGIPLADGTRYV